MLLYYIVGLFLAALALLLAIVLGDYGPWYLSWFLGTGFMVLVAAASGVLFEAQEEAAGDKPADAGKTDVVGLVAGKAPDRP